MNRQLVNRINVLSTIVFAQTIEIENQRRRIDSQTHVLRKCKETNEALMKALFGNVEVYDIGGQS